MGLELLTDDRVDGHQAEDTGLANTTFCVVIALQTDREIDGNTEIAALVTCKHEHKKKSKDRWLCEGGDE